MLAEELKMEEEGDRVRHGRHQTRQRQLVRLCVLETKERRVRSTESKPKREGNSGASTKRNG